MNTPAEALELRVHNEGSSPTLIYLPGLHGDWTLVASFRSALAGHLRFVEITYPRTLTWTLDDYAASVESALHGQGIRSGWLLGESFSSLVVWAMVARGQFQIQGVILAGGFVRHPARWAARIIQRVCGGVPLTLLTRILFAYAKLARFRYRYAPETLRGIHEFVARRTELDRQAAKHRLGLVAQNDPRPVAQKCTVPVFALAGFLDPIVPWFAVRPWLRRHCPSLREYRIIWRADHNVLGTAPQAAAIQVLAWIREGSCPTENAKSSLPFVALPMKRRQHTAQISPLWFLHLDFGRDSVNLVFAR